MALSDMRAFIFLLLIFIVGNHTWAQTVTKATGNEAIIASSKGIQLREGDAVQFLDDGEVSTPRYIIGGILGTYPIGFGIGHAIQGRYSDRGWIFTATEAASLAVVIAGVGECLGLRLTF